MLITNTLRGATRWRQATLFVYRTIFQIANTLAFCIGERQ